MRLFIASLLLVTLLVTSGCESKRTITKVSNPKSRLFGSTMGSDPTDLSKRSSFDTNRTEAKESSNRSSFQYKVSDTGSKAYRTKNSDLQSKLFGQRDKKTDHLSKRSRYQDEGSDLTGKIYDTRGKPVKKPAVKKLWTKVFADSKESYNARNTSEIDGWNADSLPPNVVLRPENQVDIQALSSEASLRRALGK